ncbi:uncharacterized protein At1g01500-like [Macadamia integrifolia]|uniref:uncharacterized protein At1g01500-like n=1 Tax=Macadamia integrifolia TaxID=60698 RepID=UPI001C4E5C60|nr:uncharacterized protein At1g01500-like [Macadamia integrifolia]XP_042494150.1 uncharacterized protein At1g01500-like [Macadamia integrifolia]XP_042494151.1 uncharacterized protein At1g01500-like [Macadamia integrifolia]XP_042494152.1 uncharacterized protein At1g01500-like [Macadamia integrifolia]XP_042494153.1 uncharacterized protein At1g01500-like [Macadamia integrifolia]XP_042494155.1 uncharacterized protein At1g01500-like [Macadamia integrifolia]XP_042494156.1 uncharacterized protein At
MDCSYETMNEDELADSGRKIIRQSPYQACSKLSLPWFELRVFYVRISNFEVDDLTPEYLRLNHIPLNPDTLLEFNNVKGSISTEGVTSLLRRDRVDKKSEEVTFVSTDSTRMTGSVKFDVYDTDDLLLSGVLEMSNGFTGESKNHCKRWTMTCQSHVVSGTCFLKEKQHMGLELPSPTIEVYVAGCFSGTPIILTKTLQLCPRKKTTRKGMLGSIPEYETTEGKKDDPSELDYQIVEYHCKPESLDDYNDPYSRAEYIESDEGELSWFNAGVRVGVGIGLGICLGLGIGVGLLVRTYQATTRNFKRQLV